MTTEGAGHEADGVFQGGGVKGLALAGALEAFAEGNPARPGKYFDKWVQLAGTSAGAIVAAYLATGHDAAQTAALIKETNFAQFEDFGPGGRFVGGATNLVRFHGLARGRVFRDWFDKQVAGQTFSDVERAGRTLRLIATDITRREMLVLPEALAEYRRSKGAAVIDPAAFAVADAVRMSMSIPYFFQPVELVHKETGLTSTIVDGGVLSNFPVWIFDTEKTPPAKPTFGFKLIGGKGVAGGLGALTHALGWPAEMGSDIFHTATDAWDAHWVRASTWVRTCAIKAGDIGTTDFGLSEAQKEWLLNSGRKAASDFLDAWEPGDYVNSHGLGLVPPQPKGRISATPA